MDSLLYVYIFVPINLLCLLLCLLCSVVYVFKSKLTASIPVSMVKEDKDTSDITIVEKVDEGSSLVIRNAENTSTV